MMNKWWKWRNMLVNFHSFVESLTPLRIKTQGIGKQWWAQMGNEN